MSPSITYSQLMTKFQAVSPFFIFFALCPWMGSKRSMSVFLTYTHACAQATFSCRVSNLSSLANLSGPGKCCASMRSLPSSFLLLRDVPNLCHLCINECSVIEQQYRVQDEYHCVCPCDIVVFLSTWRRLWIWRGGESFPFFFDLLVAVVLIQIDSWILQIVLDEVVQNVLMQNIWWDNGMMSESALHGRFVCLSRFASSDPICGFSPSSLADWNSSGENQVKRNRTTTFCCLFLYLL